MHEFENFGLIHTDDVRAAGDDPRELRRLAARGHAIRVRRGVYCEREHWDSLSNLERHILQTRAVVRAAHPPFLVAASSAAAVWGMPFAAEWPIEVTLLAPYRGGGKSEPGVRRTSAGGIDVRRVIRFAIPVTNLARTALDVARTLDFPDAVAVFDRCLAEKNPLRIEKAELMAELTRVTFARGGSALARAVEFAAELSGSVGESRCRAVIHRLGFAAPILQQRFVDSEGEMFCDFFWEEVGKAGEFDGKVKFTNEEYTSGDPVEALWREKKREDRLRRQVAGVVRILHSHVENPRVLERMLDAAGIPRCR